MVSAANMTVFFSYFQSFFLFFFFLALPWLLRSPERPKIKRGEKNISGKFQEEENGIGCIRVNKIDFKTEKGSLHNDTRFSSQRGT